MRSFLRHMQIDEKIVCLVMSDNALKDPARLLDKLEIADKWISQGYARDFIVN